MLFFGVVIAFCLLRAIAGQGNSYDTSCVCTQALSTGSFCWAWRCRTDQVTKCFPNSATVEIRDGRQRVPMKDVQIGDQILVDVDSHGQRIYESVYAFIPVSETGVYAYLKITVDQISEQPLTISSNHLIFRFNQTKPCFACHLNIGDQLQVISNDGLFRAGAIQDIRLIKSQGFYAPLTRSGKLVVDGISVSNYALVANHQLAHLVIQPYRWALSLLGSSAYSEQIH